MKKLHFPRPFNHQHPPVRNVNDIFEEQLTFGQRAADNVARFVGTWKFIIIQTIILTIWVTLNIVGWFHHWDPYPFILMNLTLSFQAAYTAPLIMMSQNRQTEHDRIEAHNDYLINQKSEKEIRVILEHLAAQDEALLELHEMLREMKQED